MPHRTKKVVSRLFRSAARRDCRAGDSGKEYEFKCTLTLTHRPKVDFGYGTRRYCVTELVRAMLQTRKSDLLQMRISGLIEAPTMPSHPCREAEQPIDESDPVRQCRSLRAISRPFGSYSSPRILQSGLYVTRTFRRVDERLPEFCDRRLALLFLGYSMSRSVHRIFRAVRPSAVPVPHLWIAAGTLFLPVISTQTPLTN